MVPGLLLFYALFTSAGIEEYRRPKAKVCFECCASKDRDNDIPFVLIGNIIWEYLVVKGDESDFKYFKVKDLLA